MYHSSRKFLSEKSFQYYIAAANLEAPKEGKKTRENGCKIRGGYEHGDMTRWRWLAGFWLAEAGEGLGIQGEAAGREGKGGRGKGGLEERMEGRRRQRKGMEQWKKKSKGFIMV